MTVALLGAVLVQIVTIILLRNRLGRRWFRHPVTVLVLTSTVYQGVSPLLLAFPSVGASDAYRNGIGSGYEITAMLLLSGCMLALAVAYLLLRPEQAVNPVAIAGAPVRPPDWRLLALVCIPLAALTYVGRGYNGTALPQGSPSVTSDLASGFFVLLTVLAVASFLLRHGTRWFFPALAVQSIILGAAGERTPVITGAITLILLLTRAGATVPARQIGAAFAVTIVGILAITGARAQQGRALYTGDTGLVARASALGKGLIPGTEPVVPGTPGLAAQAASRLDGVSFTAGILQAQHLGQPRLSAAYVPESLLMAVPSAMWPSKLAHEAALNPAQEELTDYGLQQVNFLSGLPGLYVGFLSPFWLAALMAALGMIAATGEKWLMRELTPPRLVLYAGAMLSAMTFEAGLPAMLTTLRAAIVLALATFLSGLPRLRGAPLSNLLSG